MEKQIEKALDKIQKLLAKNQVAKAEQLLRKELATSPSNHDLLRQEFSFYIKYESWHSAIGYLKQKMRLVSLQELIDQKNSDYLFVSFKENPAFKSAFFELLLNQQLYDSIWYLLNLGDPRECEDFVQSWKDAAEQITDPVTAGNWYVACGIAYVHCRDMTGFKHSWEEAVKTAPGVLPALIGFCQRTRLIDLEGAEERVFLIELFLLSGAIKKGIALMKVMGTESTEHARLLLRHFEQFEIHEDTDKAEFLLVLSSLSVFAGDVTFLNGIQGEWSSLSTEQLFILQKSLQQSGLKHEYVKKLLIGVVQAYFQKEDWESSAQLLETMAQEARDPEIIAMMEHLLERYPIIPRLHILVGDFQLERGLISQAVEHYALVKEVPEFHHASIQKMEKVFVSSHQDAIIQYLIDLYPSDSPLIPLLGLRILLSSDHDETPDWFPNKFLELMPLQDLSPFWFMFLVRLGIENEDLGMIAQFVVRFIEEAPDSCYELCPLLEKHSALFSSFSVQLISSITKNLNRLKHLPAWRHTLKVLEATSTISQNLVHTDFFKTLHEVETYLEDGEFKVGFHLLESMTAKFPETIEEAMKFLDSLSIGNDEFALWSETKMRILLENGQFESLYSFGSSLLMDHRMRTHVPLIHQYLGLCQKSMRQPGKAMEHFCYGSLEKKWYGDNFEFLIEHLFQGHEEYLTNVLALVKQYNDDSGSQELLEVWFEHHPEDILKIYQFSHDFYNHHKTAKSTSNLVFWAITNREFDHARDILKTLDPRNPEYGVYLPRIVQLFKLKQPQDPTARFLLGRFFLFQGETAKAVDVFRTLVNDLPHTIDDVFIYLKKSLDKGICSTDPQMVFGLLIRIALDQKLYRESIDLLRDFGKRDQKVTSTFIEGVFKVLRTAPQEKQVFFEFLKLNAEWGDYNKVCEIEETGVLQEELHEERLLWLQTASTVPELKNRALALRAKILFSIRNIEGCRKLLLLASEHAGFPDLSSELIPITRNLLNRFPDDEDLRRIVAFSSWRNQDYRTAVAQFNALLSSEMPQFRLESYAMLKDMGEHPDMHAVFPEYSADRNSFYEKLSEFSQQLNEVKLAWAQEGTVQPTENLFFWLLEESRLQEFSHLIRKVEHTMSEKRIYILQAYYLRAKGKINQAAFRLLNQSCPVALKKMFLMEAGLWEQALLLENRDEPDLILRKRIWRMQGNLRMALLNLQHLKYIADPTEGAGNE